LSRLVRIFLVLAYFPVKEAFKVEQTDYMVARYLSILC
jgi:hypothetical protein